MDGEEGLGRAGGDYDVEGLDMISRCFMLDAGQGLDSVD